MDQIDTGKMFETGKEERDVQKSGSPSASSSRPPIADARACTSAALIVPLFARFLPFAPADRGAVCERTCRYMLLSTPNVASHPSTVHWNAANETVRKFEESLAVTLQRTLCASVAVKVGLQDARALEPLAAELAFEALALRRLAVDVARRRLWPWLSRLVDCKSRTASASDTSTTLSGHTETQTNASGADVRLVRAAG